MPESDTHRLRMIAARAEEAQIVEVTDLPLGTGIARDVVRDGKGILIQDIANETRARPLPGTSTVSGTLICIPMFINTQTTGLMVLTRHTSTEPFTQTDLDLLSMLMPQAAVAIRNAQLYGDGQRRIAELTAALARQKKLDHAKDQFIQNVSHELRTPIAIARGYAELLDNGTLGDLQPNQQEPVAIVARRLKMLSSLVNDINAIFEVEAQRQAFTKVDITVLANNAISDFRILAKSACVNLSENITSAPLVVSGDSIHLRRVLDNLLINALKFTPEGGTITVHLKEAHRHAILEVVDTGIGIPDDKLTRIFERFYQVEAAISHCYGGSGLGLSLVKQIVESHKGTVEVESELGTGSTFKVTLPLLAEANPA